MADDQAAGAAQFEFVFQHSGTGILLIERDGTLRRFNPAAAALLALGAHARGQSILTLFEEQPHLRAALESDKPSEEPITLASRREVRISSTEIGSGRIVLLDDVTAQRAVDAGRAALVRQVAHDLRNPIHALSGFADLAATEPGISPEQTEYLERVQRIAEKLQRLAGTLVDLAWIESGMPLAQSPVALGDVIRAAVDDQADEALRRSATVTLDLPVDLPPVLGDAERLKQALVAVLRNALLYAPLGAPVSVRAWAEPGEVRCTVQDRGFGFTPADRLKAFDRLWRSADPRVQAIPGGGIGLTLAQAILRRHGGEITIESASIDENMPERGTTVTLALPTVESW